jgi:hypothetical protein
LAFCAPADIEITAKSVLCDEGGGLKKFCRKRRFCIRRYRCHRHLIEKFGGAIILVMLVARILRIQDEEVFKKLYRRFHDQADALLAKKAISQKSYKKFKLLLGEKPGDFVDGIWERILDAIARCSNHAERFHGIVNAIVKKVKRFVLRLERLHQAIIDRQEAMTPDKDRRQLHTTLTELRKCAAPQTNDCKNSKCAAYRRVMASRFRLDSFPCEHMIEAWNQQIPPLPPIEECEPRISFKLSELDPAKLKGFGKDFLSKDQRLYRSRRQRKSTNIATGEDESRAMDPSEQPDKAVEIPKYQFLREIIKGVIKIRNRKGSNLPRVDPFHRSHDIIDHFKRAFAERDQEGWSEGEDGEREQQKWLCSYEADWWAWAAYGGDPPSGHPDEKWSPKATDDADDHPIALGVLEKVISPQSAQIGSSSAADADIGAEERSMPRQNAILPIGLTNFGSTCYFNAPIQCLVHLDALHSFFDVWQPGPQAPILMPAALAYRELQAAMDRGCVEDSLPSAAKHTLTSQIHPHPKFGADAVELILQK